MKTYAFVLQKKSKKLTCPKCGHSRCFVPFVKNDGQNSNVVNAELFGRCDREQNCGYYAYPTNQEITFTPPPPKVVKLMDLVPEKLMLQTLKHYEINVLFKYFTQFFEVETLTNAFLKYKVGTSKNGSTIWWQVDHKQAVRTGKIMKYLPNGHRDKSNFGSWVHTRLKADYELRQCLFGLHLIKLGDNVAICESEKTAVIMSILRPEFVWVATGGSKNIQSEKLNPLRGCTVTFFADKGMVSEWKKQVGKIGTFDTTLEKSTLENGADILDYYLLKLEKIC